jgi:hypothetical protein
MMMGNPNAFAGRFLAHEAAAGVYLEEGVRRALEDNQRQIAEAEQRQREREEREAAEAKAAAEADRVACTGSQNEIYGMSGQPNLLRLDARKFHHLGPLLGIVRYKPAKVSGRTGKYRTTRVG